MNFDRIERWLFLVATTVLISFGEWLLLQKEFILSILLYAGMLQLILLYIAYRWNLSQRYLMVLLIPSIIRLMNFTLPLEQLSSLFAQLVVSIPLALTGVVFVWLLKEGQFRFIFQVEQIPFYIFLIVAGGAMGIALFQFNTPPPPIGSSPIILFFNIFVLIVSMAFLEEWLFRGIMQTALTHVYGNKVAMFVVALFYTILHIDYNSGPFLLLIFIFAYGLSWLRRNTDNLLSVCLVHGAVNITFFLVLPSIII